MSDGGPGIKAVVDDCVFLGQDTHYFMHLESGQEVEVVQESEMDEAVKLGAEVSLRLNAEKINLFTADGSANMLTGVRNDAN